MTVGLTVTRVPYLRTDKNAHRGDVIVRGAPAEVWANGFDPETTTEVDGTRIVQPAVLFLPAGAAAHPLDQWIIRGDTYEVAGAPTKIWNDFSGRQHKTEIDLKRVTG